MLTHLDLDHVGGVSDFPRARVHVYGHRAGGRQPPARHGARPILPVQWQAAKFVEHVAEGDDWLGFESVSVLDGDDVLLVPLHGHSRGHAAVAVREDDGRWLLHAGDAYFHTGDLTEPPTCPRLLKITQNILGQDNEVRLNNQERLRRFQAEHGDQVRIFSAHDPTELAAFLP